MRSKRRGLSRLLMATLLLALVAAGASPPRGFHLPLARAVAAASDATAMPAATDTTLAPAATPTGTIPPTVEPPTGAAVAAGTPPTDTITPVPATSTVPATPAPTGTATDDAARAVPNRPIPPCGPGNPSNPTCPTPTPAPGSPAAYPPGVYGPGGSCCYGQYGTWFSGGGVGLIGKEVWTYANGPTEDSHAQWDAGGLGQGVAYAVSAYIPNNNANAKARYTVYAAEGALPVTVDQQAYTNAWAELGTYCPDSRGHIFVHISDAGDAYPKVVGADAMRFVPAHGACPQPPPPPRQWDDPANFQDPNAPDYGIYWVRCGTCRGGQSDEVKSTTPNLGLDYYNPTAPTVIYVHGWENFTVATKYRESMRSPIDTINTPNPGPIDMAGAWKAKGYNVGIFYWNQFSDDNLLAAEEKIWASDNMTWKYFNPTTNGSQTRPPYVGHGSAADLFVDSYVQAMQNYRGSYVRIVGHSLGNQMAARMTYLLAKNWVDTGKIGRNALPRRVALLDPYYNPGHQTYLCGPAFQLPQGTCESAADEVAKEVGVLKGSPYGIAFEYYSTSAIPVASNVASQMTLVHIDPAYVNGNVPNAHAAARHWYFTSMYVAPPVEYVCRIVGRGKICDKPDGPHTPSAALSDDELHARMQGQHEWYQRDGQSTRSVQDDTFNLDH